MQNLRAETRHWAGLGRGRVGGRYHSRHEGPMPASSSIQRGESDE